MSHTAKTFRNVYTSENSSISVLTAGVRHSTMRRAMAAAYRGRTPLTHVGIEESWRTVDSEQNVIFVVVYLHTPKIKHK